jgi:hypothetical protein
MLIGNVTLNITYLKCALVHYDAHWKCDTEHHRIEMCTSALRCSRGKHWRSWFMQVATSCKVSGLIPDGGTGIFHWHNTSCCTITLGFTQPLTVMSTRNISWEVKVAGAYGWQPYHLHVLIVLKSGSLNLLEPSGPFQDCNGIALLWCL